MTMNKVNDEFKDDGRTVADMDIPGMPWYAGPNDRLGDRPKAKRNSLVEERIVLTKREKRAIYKGIIAAILPLVLAFAVGYFFIFLFLDKVWLS